MAKRFVDTEIWKRQRWFRKLSPIHKLAFLYVKDCCDHAGIWKIDCLELVEDLGIDGFDLDNFVQSCNVDYEVTTGKQIFKERVKIVNDKFLWLTGFIQFQYQGKLGKVSENQSCVKSSLSILKKYEILEYAVRNSYVTLAEPLDIPSIRVNEPFGRDKDKDKDRVKDYSEGESKTDFSLEGGVGETLSFPVVENPPTPPTPPQATPTFDEVITNFFAETGIASNPPGFPNWRSDCQAFLKDAYQHKALVKETGLGDAEIAKHKMDFLARLNVESDFKNLPALKKHFVNYIRKHVSANAVRGKSSAFHEPKTRNYAKANGWD